jgi:hypothetical protein
MSIYRRSYDEGTSLDRTIAESPDAEYSDIWTRKEFRIHVDFPYLDVEVDGWVHWSRRFGLHRIYQDEKINTGLPPYALFHIPASLYGWLYPNHDTANILASWLFSCPEMNRDQPQPLSPERVRDGEALKKIHGVVKEPFDLIHQTDEGFDSFRFGVLPSRFASWEEYRKSMQ